MVPAISTHYYLYGSSFYSKSTLICAQQVSSIQVHSLHCISSPPLSSLANPLFSVMTNHYRPCSAHNAHDDSPPGRASSDERSPLLNADANAPTPVLVEASSKFPRRNLLLCGAFILLPTLLQSGSSLQLVPFNQVLENAICRRLYPDLDLLLPAQSGHCSNNEAVQAELSLLRGWQNTLDLIPGK